MARRPKSQSGSFGQLSYRPAPDEGLVPQTLEFVRNQLPNWRDDPQRPQDSSEKRLNSSLSDFLDCRSRSLCPMVRFKHEAPQSGTRTVDIGAHGTEDTTLIGVRSYTIYEPFLVIEAKRLPAPSKDREREYVTGTDKKSGSPTGGIQRFKLGLHGAGVETAAMVGYIESGLPQHWLRTINRWIYELADDCRWSTSETLQFDRVDTAKGVSSSVSVHSRSLGCVTDSISLLHLWVVMNP